jgi:hypothetical protein
LSHSGSSDTSLKSEKPTDPVTATKQGSSASGYIGETEVVVGQAGSKSPAETEVGFRKAVITESSDESSEADQVSPAKVSILFISLSAEKFSDIFLS